MPRQIRTKEDIKQLGTILSVWAHPDDETFCAGGILLTAIENGQKVICLTFTKGEAGVQDESRWPADKLGSIRANELKTALKILGITQHDLLDYPDGGCKDIPTSKAADVIIGYIEKYQPDSLLAFGPDGLTGHDDHSSVSKWVSQAVAKADIKPAIYHVIELKDRYEKYMKAADKQFNIYFNIDKPPLAESKNCDIYFKLPKKEYDTKFKAFASMPSQTERLLKNGDPAMIQALLSQEAFVLASK